MIQFFNYKCLDINIIFFFFISHAYLKTLNTMWQSSRYKRPIERDGRTK